MLNNALGLLRRHGPARLAQVVGDLFATYGARGTLRLVVSRLHAPKGKRGLSLPRGPIGELADVDAAPVRSTVFRSSNLVLIGTLDLPQCKKYRIVQRQEMLERETGKVLPYTGYRDIHRWRTMMQAAGALILYRVPAGYEFDLIMREAERLGLHVCYDIDDPVFDLETVQANPNLAFLPASVQRSLIKDAGDFAAAMQRCHRITVSTPGLQELVRRRFPHAICHVVPNGIDAETVHFGAVARSEVRVEAPQPFRILLPSGSLAHAADTAVALEGLRLFLRDRPDTELITIGYFDPGGALREHHRFKELPYMAYSEYMRVLGTATCALVPLVDGPFNHGKSIIRLIDATMARVPVIASPVGEYADPAVQGAYLAASSPETWRAALERLASSTEERERLVELALTKVGGPRRLSSLWSALDPDLQRFYRSDTVVRVGRAA